MELSRKLRKLLAGAFLLPALVRHGSGVPSTDGHISFRELKYRLRLLAENKDRHVRKRNFLYDISVYYPYRCAEELLKNTKTSALFLRAVRLPLRILFPIAANSREEEVNRRIIQARTRLHDINEDDLYNIICASGVNTVSFDIFDTLLTRPVLNDPREIFYLLAQKVDKKYNIDFVKIRWNAEAELEDKYATLDDIYDYIAKANRLPAQVRQELMAEEIACETRLLAPRKMMLDLCGRLAKKGKRIIATSDMYLSSPRLLSMLHVKGFQDIAAVYVSCEAKAGKSDDGALFDHVLKHENLTGGMLFHIGDNEKSDYEMALRKNVLAIHLPSPMDLCRKKGATVFPDIAAGALKNPLWGLLMAHSLEQIFQNPAGKQEDLDSCSTPARLMQMVLGPAAFLIALNGRRIALENGYKKLFFASRDGWLPFIFHTRLSEKFPGPQGVYIMAGRRAYWPFLENGFLEVLAKVRREPECAQTLEELIRTYFGKDAEKLLVRLDEAERSTPINQYGALNPEILKILAGVGERMSDLIRTRANRIRTYYQKMLADCGERALVFDLGYSGSISKALAKAASKPVDKIYCWEEPENRNNDSVLGSRTFALLSGEAPTASLMLEELFSPCQGGTVDFDDNGNPIGEKTDFPDSMRNFYSNLQDEAQIYATSALGRFGQYAQCLDKASLEPTMAVIENLFYTDINGNLGLLRNICFPDPVALGRGVPSLQSKIENRLNFEDVYERTGFENPQNILPQTDVISLPSRSFKAAIHIHIHNPLLAEEFFRRLKVVPVPFDLFISYHHASSERELKSFFSCLPNVGTCQFFHTPDRGRDIAPWLIETDAVQNDYDLFCHVHGKESRYLGFGDAWRAYMLDNLLRPEAIGAVWNAFAAHDNLGLIFPAPYGPVRRVMSEAGLSVWGTDSQREIMRNALSALGIDTQYGRTDQIFSVGTMMWYRPNALAGMFSAGFTYDDFPGEPAPRDGTLAHAFERIPPLVANHNGYSARILTIFPSRYYFQDYLP